jgi:hypothetical protein
MESFCEKLSNFLSVENDESGLKRQTEEVFYFEVEEVKTPFDTQLFSSVGNESGLDNFTLIHSYAPVYDFIELSLNIGTFDRTISVPELRTFEVNFESPEPVPKRRISNEL